MRGRHDWKQWRRRTKTEFQTSPLQFATEKRVDRFNTNASKMHTLTTSIADVITFILADNLMKNSLVRWLLLKKRVAIGQSKMIDWDRRMRRFDDPVDSRRQTRFIFCLRTNNRRHRSFSACRENGQTFKHYNSYIRSIICTKARRKEQLRPSTFLWVASWLQPIFPWGKNSLRLRLQHIV